ncbi:carboxymuconolactone decarboxylase family protein [Kribbella sp. NPDC056861]|uniref:carboxymuconolactone decarboxylase family protein n=1 Tax=Kribbella sp. NPDC056861 TaxID=3154857 RepID=UPI003449650D
MSRLPHFDPADLDPGQRDLYDRITDGPRASGPQYFALTDDQGRLNGPFNALLTAPPVGEAIQQLGSVIRYRTSLPDRIRELAILVVAAGWDCAFEQYAHEPIARAAGILDSELAELRELRVPRLADEGERAAVELVLELVRDGDAADSTYDRAVSIIGNRMVFELTALVGYYSTLALQLRVFRVLTPRQTGQR